MSREVTTPEFLHDLSGRLTNSFTVLILSRGALVLPVLLSGCAIPTSIVPIQNNQTAISTVAQQNTTGSYEINLAGCQIKLREPYFWRDWQPDVDQPGPAGGSPLYASADLTLSNPQKNRMAVSWEVWLEDSDNRSLIMQTTNRSGLSNSGAILDPESTTSTSLMIRNGPYLRLGLVLVFILSFAITTPTELFIPNQGLCTRSINHGVKSLSVLIGKIRTDHIDSHIESHLDVVFLAFMGNPTTVFGAKY